MLPIGDYAGRRRGFPLVNVSLILVNVVVFLYEVSLSSRRLEVFISSLGAVPAAIVGGSSVVLAQGSVVPAWVTLFTSLFIHASWLHLGGNMLYLWVFGDNVEDSFGHGRYLVFYLVAGVVATFAQIFVDPASRTPTVGASGAIAGVMGAYLVMFPGAKVRTIVLLVFFITVIYLPAVLVIGVWFALQLVSGIGSLGVPTQQSGGVAVWAHIGGLVAGAVLAGFFRRRDYRRATPTSY